jgi:hypothetical protein
MPDIVIITSQYIYIIEVKLDTTPEFALQQIEEKTVCCALSPRGKDHSETGRELLFGEANDWGVEARGWILSAPRSL